MSFEAELEFRYELRKGGRLESGKANDKGGRVLNRIVWWADEGLENETDARQAAHLIASVGLNENCKSCVTPRSKPTAEQAREEKPLEEEEHTSYRGNSARCNYLWPDRLGVQYCAQEICRRMASPTNLDQTF